MILATVDFSKALDYVWHRALFPKLISALPLYFVWRTQSFLFDERAGVVFQNSLFSGLLESFGGISS